MPPFRLQDVQLWIDTQRLLHLQCPLADLALATFASLTFTNQKSGVRGEVIGHQCSGYQHACPVRAIPRRILYLHEHNAHSTTPLNGLHHNHRWTYVTANNVTVALRASAALIGLSLGFLPSDVSAHSLRVGGAMALLCAHVDTNRICSIGRWRSNEMLQYLHLQAQPVMQDLARHMLVGGTYTLIPGQDVPNALVDLPNPIAP